VDNKRRISMSKSYDQVVSDSRKLEAENAELKEQLDSLRENEEAYRCTNAALNKVNAERIALEKENAELKHKLEALNLRVARLINAVKSDVLIVW
jgi:archaellum component FlaC